MKATKTNPKRPAEANKRWQLQEAKNRLSQVVDQALHDGPQTITLRGKPAAVVISAEQFDSLTRPRTSLTKFFRQSPLHGIELDLTRSKELPREIEL
jgi:prevent-host-death family protein